MHPHETLHRWTTWLSVVLLLALAIRVLVTVPQLYEGFISPGSTPVFQFTGAPLTHFEKDHGLSLAIVTWLDTRKGMGYALAMLVGFFGLLGLMAGRFPGVIKRMFVLLAGFEAFVLLLSPLHAVTMAYHNAAFGMPCVVPWLPSFAGFSLAFLPAAIVVVGIATLVELGILHLAGRRGWRGR